MDVLKVPCMKAVVLYNEYRSLVDRNNQKRSESDLLTTFRRWWVRNFWNGPVIRMEINRWRALLHESPRKSLTFLEYRQELCLDLVAPYMAQKVILLKPLPTIFTDSHFLVKIAQRPRPVCAVCESKKSHCGYMYNACKLSCHHNCFNHMIHK